MIISNLETNFLLELLLEVLPISSSGHIELISYFFSSIKPLSALDEHLSHVLIFLIQIIYIFPFLKILVYRKKWILILYIVINFISITALTTIGYLVKHLILMKMFPTLSMPLPLGFLITTIFLLSIYFINKSKSRTYYTLSFKESIFLGLWQCIALLPGVSRLATMILGAQVCGFTRKNSLFIAIASNAAISGCSLLYLIYYNYNIENIIFSFSTLAILKLISTLFISALFFFLFIYFFNKNNIFILIIYEFLILLISYYIY
jgi:undecaprenyl-diphosphatase